MIRQIRIFIISLVLLSITACSTYPNKFKCGDAKGLGCTMLAEIDRQIDSGKIEEVYKDKKCSGKRCSSLSHQDGFRLKTQDKARKYNDQNDESEKIDDENLYF
ncbi:MAG: hypothetical protein COB76_02170 [Alphaproteobacteria bacterium]|nr:MAG: hypothetical protein COB76_02170 [Alphaproteobacteria bacterium]